MSSASSVDDENSRSPDDLAQLGLWEVEPIYYSVPGRQDKSRRGKVYRRRKDGELRSFEAHDGIVYKPGDYVYLETSNHEPFLVGTVSSFKMTKRDALSVKVTRFYRPEDVPEISLSLILQERLELESEEQTPSSSRESTNAEELSTHARELFSSETSAAFAVSSLRGKCEVSFVKDFRSIGECDLSKENTFFSCLSFNQESSRLASVQGEIRVGGAFQAKLPAEASCSVSDDADRDELLYRPDQISSGIEQMYIKLARSFRLFAMLDSKMTDIEKNSRISDLLTDDSLTTLHRCGYKYDEALKEMNANDKLLSADANFMTVDDTKKFGKGIKTYGKNFVKISRELLPMHSRDQLVGYYYLWKKSADATKPKALSRQRNQTAASLKRASKNGQPKASRPASTELLDYTSASESEMEAHEAEGRTLQYACHHCYGSHSRDWHHAGKDNLLLCTDCRVFFKKYGQLRPVDRPSTVPPCLFKQSPSNTDAEEENGVRTRAGKKDQRRTPSIGDERRSPSQAVSVHEFELDKKPRIGKRKKPAHVNGSAKKRKEDADDDSGKEEEKKDETTLTTLPKVEVKMEETEPNREELSENGSSAEGSSSAVIVSSSIHNGHAVVDTKMEESTTVKQEDELLKDAESTSSMSTLADVAMEEEAADDTKDDGIWSVGDEVILNTKNASFVQSIVRSCGQMCSRTDLTFRVLAGSTWDKKLKERRERPVVAAAPQPIIPQPQQQQQHAVLATPQPQKKPENALESMQRMPMSNGQMSFGMNGFDPFALAAMLQQQQQAALMEQQQNMMKQMEMHRLIQQQQQQAAQQQAQQQAAQQQRNMLAVPPFMDQRMAGMFGQQPSATDLQRLHAEQVMMTQLAAHAASPMLPPEMQQMIMQQMIMQQMNGGGASIPMTMLPTSQADMMRRLQQENFPLSRPQ